jgi:predicted Fe-Mo cluster-binding NifX family protein
MKIVVASDGEDVSQHFGHCMYYRTYDAEDGAITNEGSIANPGHRPNFLPGFLKENGADVIISGGMGEAAINLFRANGIEVVVGASGDARSAAERFLTGKLVSTGSVCREHRHHDECGEHRHGGE